MTLGGDMRELVKQYAAEKWIERHTGYFDEIAKGITDQMPVAVHQVVLYEVRKAIAERFNAMEPLEMVTIDQVLLQVHIAKSPAPHCPHCPYCPYCQRYISYHQRIVVTDGAIFHADCLSVAGYVNG